MSRNEENWWELTLARCRRHRRFGWRQQKMTSRLESKMTQETQVSSGPRNVITKYEEDLGSDAAILSSTCAHTLKTLYSSCYHALCCFIHKLTGDTISNNFVSFCKANLQYTTQYSQLMCENYCVSGSYLFSFVLGSTLPQMV